MRNVRCSSRPLTRREALSAANSATSRFIRGAGFAVVALGLMVGLKAGLKAEETRLDEVAAAQAAADLSPAALCRGAGPQTVEAVAAQLRAGLDGSAHEARIEAALAARPSC